MYSHLLLSDHAVEVRFGPIFQRFPRTGLGIMRAANYVMTFGRPVQFWSGDRQLQNLTAFLQEMEVHG
ncbi:hypothetical protein [Anthocerotibacter panamensis]|uniref:hypothetical protein n=1 Tax=Anthocerotibacter panamensis TaxID=2857077 RepID=UPI001C40432E|nr:hypothetical protein [Anthocerotibacter panamensis]